MPGRVLRLDNLALRYVIIGVAKRATTRPCSPTPVIKHSINECPVIAKTFRDPMDEDLQSRFGAGPTLGYEGRRQRPALWPALPFG
jgi:hypothetical protein